MDITFSTSTGGSDIILPDGLYTGELDAVAAYLKTANYDGKAKEIVKLRFEWQVQHDPAAAPVKVVDWANLPQGFAYTPRANFFPMVGKIAGVTVSPANLNYLSISLLAGRDGPQIVSWEQLIDYLREPSMDGRLTTAYFGHLAWGGNDLIGCQRKLFIQAQTGDDGVTRNRIGGVTRLQ